jgi:glycosyltransferase involved in cell wall biosynthesis
MSLAQKKLNLIPNECLISVVVPVFNEQKAIPIFIKHVIPVLNNIATDFEIIFVNDGSSDETLSTLTELHLNDKRI